MHSAFVIRDRGADNNLWGQWNDEYDGVLCLTECEEITTMTRKHQSDSLSLYCFLFVMRHS